jgi:hypothetical protein
MIVSHFTSSHPSLVHVQNLTSSKLFNFFHLTLTPHCNTTTKTMAIIDAIPGLTVEVIVNNIPLREYPDPEADAGPKQATTYIEAHSGSTFWILTKFLDDFFAISDFSLETRLDGDKFSS